jgi:uroporphyrinogen-III decarboxylase
VGERYLKNPYQMLDLKLKVASNSIQGQDPDVEALGPELYKQYAKIANVPLVLGVGAAFLVQSSPQQVEERVKHYVEVGKVGGKFVLYLCNISSATPPENIRAAVETAHSL